MHWPKVQGCEKRSATQPMDVEDVQGAFYIFGAFLFLSCLGLAAENLLHEYCRHNKMRQCKKDSCFKENFMSLKGNISRF